MAAAMGINRIHVPPDVQDFHGSCCVARGIQLTPDLDACRATAVLQVEHRRRRLVL